MTPLAGKRALVLGRDPSGEAAVALLRRHGAHALWRDAAAGDAGGAAAPDLVVVSAGCEEPPPLARDFAARGVPVLAERELGFQQSLCLHAAVAGVSGKSTTADLIAHLLRSTGRRVEVAEAVSSPACALADQAREIDLMLHIVAPGEPEFFQFFRPVVGVLLNVPAETPDADAGAGDRLRRMGRLFACQQAFDWAIVQSEALARLEAVGAAPRGKRITFSTSDRRADLGWDRGLLLSRLEGWTGPLWDTSRGRLRGPHFAEDALAALAVGRVLRVPLEQMTGVLGGFTPGPARLERLGEAGGVVFYHDGRAQTPDALAKALLTLAPTVPGKPFIRLVAGGPGSGRHFHDVGPLLASRVCQAVVYGEAAASMRTAWQLFAPCSSAASLLDAIHSAVEEAVEGDVILFSPACPSGGSHFNPQHGGDVFREAFRARLKPVTGASSEAVGAPRGEPGSRPSEGPGRHRARAHEGSPPSLSARKPSNP